MFVSRDARDEGFKGICPFHGDCVEGLTTNNSIKERLGLSSVEDIPALPDTHEVWDIVGGYIGTMCSNIFLTTSVEKIILGGGVFNRAVLVQKTRECFKARINKYMIHPKIDTDEALKSFNNFKVQFYFKNSILLFSAGSGIRTNIFRFLILGEI